MQFSTGNWLHKFHHVGRAKDGNEVTQKSVATSKLGNTKRLCFRNLGLGKEGLVLLGETLRDGAAVRSSREMKFQQLKW